MRSFIEFTFENGKAWRTDLSAKLFAVKLKWKEKEEEYDSTAFALKSARQNGQEWLAAYSGEFGSESVDVEISWNPKAAELLTGIKATHRGDAVVESIAYPFVRKDDVATYDNLLFSSAWGDNLRQPAKTIRDVSTSASIRFAQDYIRYAPNEVIYTYPSIMAMQHLVLYNECNSLYLAVYSESDDTMTFHGKTLGKYSLGLWAQHYPFLRCGSWTSPICSLSLAGGGWHEAAKLYASHMKEAFKTPDYPDWLRESYHGWVEKVMKYSWGGPRLRFSDLERACLEMKRETGMDHLFLVGWHDEGHDTKFPSYKPCLDLGTERELCLGIAGIHAQGGKASLYVNARLIDINGEFYQNGGKNAAVWDALGNECHESYDSGDVFAVSCPGSPEYASRMASVAGRIAGDYRADGMFEDQISCNLAPFCYNPAHGHARPSANFLPGVEKELKGMRVAHKDINPDFHTFAEGCHERFNQFYDVNQGHGEEFTWQIGEFLPEQFLYAFPDRIVTGHCADKRQLCHSMAQFKPLDVKESCYADGSTHAMIRDYVALRNKFKEFFLKGRFIDDEGFGCLSKHRVFATVADCGDICASVWAKGSEDDDAHEALIKIPCGYAAERILYARDAGFKQEGALISVLFEGPLCFLVLRKSRES
ncbi:MAG: DUF6259 domain-containing protein [Clostridiales bacterium]|jgi:hypothetical protein|nr:DUF6259 domain-containing protein [Clostridiales bacterium]